MPKFIGRDIPGTSSTHRNATNASTGLVRLTYVQACRLDPARVVKSLDTTDKGGRKSMAKRWYRWFASKDAIASGDSTANMRRRAGLPVAEIEHAIVELSGTA